MFFNNPLFICVTQFIGILEKEVEKAVGIPVAQILAIQVFSFLLFLLLFVCLFLFPFFLCFPCRLKKSQSQTLIWYSKLANYFKTFSKKKEKVGQSIIETLSNESCEWLSVVPPALFAPPRLKEALNEVFSLINLIVYCSILN